MAPVMRFKGTVATKMRPRPPLAGLFALGEPAAVTRTRRHISVLLVRSAWHLVLVLLFSFRFTVACS